MDYQRLYENCRLCPRNCGANRLAGEIGFCREGPGLRVSYVGPHFGEEPPLTGTRGSGTVFFTGCSLRCSFCQNFQISGDGLGSTAEITALRHRIDEMVRARGVHNLNMVTPDHFFPHLFQLTELLRPDHPTLPIVYNLSGYQSTDMLKIAQPYVDIYLPDFKYSDRRLSARLSGCGDYPEAALGAITEMLRQKGFLDCVGEEGLAQKGVLVRHLILPGMVQNSLDALTTLFLEFGPSLPLSIMSQYTPVRRQRQESLNRSLERGEFETVYRHALALGFERLYVQFPEECSGDPPRTPFLPDFRKEEPFAQK